MPLKPHWCPDRADRLTDVRQARGWLWSTLIGVLLAGALTVQSASGAGDAKAGRDLVELLARTAASVEPGGGPHVDVSQAVLALLRQHPDLELRSLGRTPLLHALSLPDALLVRALVAAGADTSAIAGETRGKSGQRVGDDTVSTLSLALLSGQAEIIDLIATKATVKRLRARAIDPWALLAAQQWDALADGAPGVHLVQELVAAGAGPPPAALAERIFLRMANAADSDALVRLLDAGLPVPAGVQDSLDRFSPETQARLVALALAQDRQHPGAWIDHALRAFCHWSGLDPRPLARLETWNAAGFAWPSHSDAPWGTDLCIPARELLDDTKPPVREDERQLLARFLALEPAERRDANLADRLEVFRGFAQVLLAASPAAPLAQKPAFKNRLFLAVDAAYWDALEARGYHFDASPEGLAALVMRPDVAAQAHQRGVDLLRQQGAGSGLLGAFEGDVLAEQTPPGWLLDLQLVLLDAGFDWSREPPSFFEQTATAVLRDLAAHLPPRHAGQREILEGALARSGTWREAFEQHSPAVRICALPAARTAVEQRAVEAIEAVQDDDFALTAFFAQWLDVDGDGICDLWLGYHEGGGRGADPDTQSYPCQGSLEGNLVLLSSRAFRYAEPVDLGGVSVLRRVENPVDHVAYLLLDARPIYPCEGGQPAQWLRQDDVLASLHLANPGKRPAGLDGVNTAFTDGPDLDSAAWTVTPGILTDPRKPPRWCGEGGYLTQSCRSEQSAIAPAPNRRDARPPPGAVLLTEARYAALLRTDPAVSDADARLNRAWQAAIRRLGAGADGLRQAQRAWLRERGRWPLVPSPGGLTGAQVAQRLVTRARDLDMLGKPPGEDAANE